MSIVQDGLILYYDAIYNAGHGVHDANATVWKDLSGNNNDAIINGAIFEKRRLCLDGIDDWVNCGQHNYSNVTFDVLVEFNTVGAVGTEYNAVMGNWQSGGSGIQQVDGKNAFDVNIGGTWYVASGSNGVIGEKIHLTATFDGSTIKIYENGVLKGTTSKTGTIKSPSNITVLSIGSNPNGSGIGITPLNGYIYSARLYNRALTDAEIASNYNYDHERFQEPEIYYLVRSNGVVYTVQNGALVALEQTEINSNLFKQSGSSEIPDNSLLVELGSHEILHWQNIEVDLLDLQAVLTATPHAQTVITSNIDISHPTVVGIESVTGECYGSPLFMCEFNGVWKEHNGAAWVDATSGMTFEVLTAITTEQWNEAISGLNSFKIKFTLDSIDDKVTTLVVNFVVDVSQAV